MRFPKTLSALAIVAVLAPIPAAASSLTRDEQRRPVRPLMQLRERMAERRMILSEQRQKALNERRLQNRQRPLRLEGQGRVRAMRLRAQLRQTLRRLTLRIRRNAIRRSH